MMADEERRKAERPIRITAVDLGTGQPHEVVVRAGDDVGSRIIDGGPFSFGISRVLLGGIEAPVGETTWEELGVEDGATVSAEATPGPNPPFPSPRGPRKTLHNRVKRTLVTYNSYPTTPPPAITITHSHTLLCCKGHRPQRLRSAHRVAPSRRYYCHRDGSGIQR